MCVAWPGADRHIGAELTVSSVRDDMVPFPCSDTIARHCGGALVPSFFTDPDAEDGNVDLQMLMIDIPAS